MSTRLDELFAELPRRLDVQDVADLLGVSPKGVYRWINTGVIPAYKLGSAWLILRDELKDTLAEGWNMLRLSSDGGGGTEPAGMEPEPMG